MQTKTLLVISVSASALLGALPAQSQPAPEAELIGLHQLCDRGDRQACIRFGFILGENREYRAEWRRSHPDWWAWNAPAEAQVASITMAPPELPVYEQPAIPAPGYIWTPGYWAYGPEGYFWIPGTWVLPPAAGLLWTPGYWGWRNGVFVWNAGYWGPHVGFYGGVNYGFGYAGVGYEGGRWNNGVFAYNQTVNNLGAVRIATVYSEAVVVRINTRVSFNGGSGGIQAQPTPQEEAVAREQHMPPTAEQSHQQQIASTNKALLASENHGQPAIAATAKPGEFSGKGVVAAREAPRGGAPTGEPPTGAKTPELNPSAARPLERNPNEPKTRELIPSQAEKSEPNPGEAAKSEVNPSGTKSLEKKGVTGGGAAPKSSSTGSKPLGGAASSQPGQPKQPQPQTANSRKPHPVVDAHPPAKQSAPAKDKKGPG
jgi:hypothetical protein